MCIICLDWQKGKLTNKEAIRNAWEITRFGDLTDEEIDHYKEVMSRAADQEADSQLKD